VFLEFLSELRASLSLLLDSLSLPLFLYVQGENSFSVWLA
jgi:hypothetical protein